jgi:ribulose 1,5-bisphosphate synthetase/thiazole synthase
MGRAQIDGLGAVHKPIPVGLVRECERAMPGRRIDDYMTNETRGDVVITGGGPAGLATGACLRARAVPFDIIEKVP